MPPASSSKDIGECPRCHKSLCSRQIRRHRTVGCTSRRIVHNIVSSTRSIGRRVKDAAEQALSSPLLSSVIGTFSSPRPSTPATTAIHSLPNSPMAVIDSPTVNSPGQTGSPMHISPTLDHPPANNDIDSDNASFENTVQDWKKAQSRRVTIEDVTDEEEEEEDTGSDRVWDSEDEEEWSSDEEDFDGVGFDFFDMDDAEEIDDEAFEQLFTAYGQGNTLTNEDLAILRALEFKLTDQLTDRTYAKFPFVFPDQRGLDTLKNSKKRLRRLAELTPVTHDCCDNVCMAYTGRHADLTECLYCHEPRFGADGKPQKRFTYVPVGPRLAAMIRNPTMATKMEYRANEYPPDPHADTKRPHYPIRDVFDGKNYRKLCKRRVVINGVEQGHRFFDQPTDIALGFSTDGFCPFRRRKKSCWPLLLFNYNLPPEIRFQLKHSLCIGVIPGPSKPKDINSFLAPFVEECLQLARGIKSFSTTANRYIKLRAYPITMFGDMPAVAMVLCIKGHNAIYPCRACKIKGIRLPTTPGTTNYVPLARPPPHEPYDASDLPLRSPAEFLRDAKHAEDPSVSKAERERRAKATGIKQVPIVADIPSFIIPDISPHDFMHLIYENLLPNLLNIWTDNFNGVEVDENHFIEATVWAAITKAAAASGSYIPTAYGARPKDILKDKIACTAETRAFWCMYLGPVLLRGVFKKKEFYHHFIDLIILLNICLQFEYTEEDVEKIRSGFIAWVEEYERLYFKYDMDRLPICPLTIHGLLHIADGIEASGPVWAYWAFPMERFCGRLRPYIKSPRRPWENVDRYVIFSSLMEQIKNTYDLHDQLVFQNVLGDSGRDWPIPNPEYSEDYILAGKRIKNPAIPAGLEGKLAAALSTRYTTPNSRPIAISTVRKYFKTHNVEIFGKVKCLNGGDTIRAADITKSTEKDSRDASFVRYHLLVDANSHLTHQQADEDLQLQKYFGQLLKIFVIHMPAAQQLHLDDPETVVLAEIRPCNTKNNEKKLRGLDIVLYKDMQAGTEIVDLTTIQCLVGRIKWKKRWAVFDRSGPLAQVIHQVNL